MLLTGSLLPHTAPPTLQRLMICEALGARSWGGDSILVRGKRNRKREVWETWEKSG